MFFEKEGSTQFVKVASIKVFSRYGQRIISEGDRSCQNVVEVAKWDTGPNFSGKPLVSAGVIDVD